MANVLDDLIENLRRCRKHFLKHLDGVRDEEWDWKPYPQCKSLRETLQHLIIDDRAALESLISGEEPSYGTEPNEIHDIGELYKTLEESHEALLKALVDRFANAPLDADICVWGAHQKLAPGLAYLASEDFYHAGQASFIRLAINPEWDYYAAIYGE